MRVTFFHTDARRFAPPAELDPDRDPQLFERGEHAWTVQTCARLARSGLPVSLSDRAPADGLVVFHAKERRALLSSLLVGADVLLVAVRADNRETGVADVEVVQNSHFADGRRRWHIPLWPQPGLIPREARRGTTISRAAFKGFSRNLAAEFRSSAWKGFLAGRGIEWVYDATDFADHLAGNGRVCWRDYSDIDLVVAVREADPRLHSNKPAVKLYTAWAAGVPAVLGPEYAYRELRRSELDYVEVADLAAAQAAVVRLQEDPGLYSRMVENGRLRAEEFSIEKILARWRELLFEHLPALAESPRGRLLRRTPVRVKQPLRNLWRLLCRRPTR